MLMTACVHHSYVSRVPALTYLPENYFETENKVLVLPLWRKLASWAHEGHEPLGYYYFGKPSIVTFGELNEIHNRIPSKTSSGIITLVTATGKWEKFTGMYLIFEDGLALYMQTEDTTGLYPTNSWSFTNHAWIGPKWQEVLTNIIHAGKDIDYSMEPSNFFWVQESIISNNRPVIIKNKLSTSARNKIISFLEHINTDTKRFDLDTWKSGVP